MGISSKDSESNNYKLRRTVQNELGNTFVYDRVEDNIDKASVLNQRRIAPAKKASNSWVSTWVFWVLFLFLSVTITSRTSLKDNYKPIDSPPVASPGSTP